MSTLGSKIVPCIWQDHQAEQAAEFYTRLLPKGQILATAFYPESYDNPIQRPRGSVSMVDFTVAGQRFTLLNGGPIFQPNPTISFFLICGFSAQVEYYYSEFRQGGEALMPIDQYPWASRYGWVKDRFGVTWQVMTGDTRFPDPYIAPCFMFTGPQHGRATEAMNFYTEVFPGGRIEGVEHFLAEEGSPNEVKHGRFVLDGHQMVAMDSPIEHDFNFNEGISLMVMCDDQAELDRYWEALAVGGSHAPCGWLKDRFGVSWQITPNAISEWMSSKDPTARDRAFAAMLKMKKLDIAVLTQALEGR